MSVGTPRLSHMGKIHEAALKGDIAEVTRLLDEGGVLKLVALRWAPTAFGCRVLWTKLCRKPTQAHQQTRMIASITVAGVVGPCLVAGMHGESKRRLIGWGVSGS